MAHTKRNPHAAGGTATTTPRRLGRERRSVILSAVAIVGIVTFAAGAVTTIISVFGEHATGGSFTGQFMGMKVTTSDTGLALAVTGALFTGLVRLLQPAAAVLFYEQDRRTWIERMPAWLGLAILLLASACLLALITGALR